MAGGKSTGNASRSRKRVEATVLKRSKDGSAFTRCEACNKDVPVVLIDMHSCSLDSKIKMMLEAEVVERIVEVPDRKRSSATAKGGRAKADNKDPKRKRTPTAFFLFMNDFRKEFKAAHPDNKKVTAVGKEAGEKWKSMTDEEKKPYTDKAAELKALAENDEGSGENKVAGEDEKPKEKKADDQDGEQEVDQPPKRRRRNKVDEEQEEEDEQNELDDDLDDDDM